MADLLAVCNAYAIGVIDENPYDTALTSGLYFQIRQLVTEPPNRGFEQFLDLFTRHDKSISTCFKTKKWAIGPFLPCDKHPLSGA